MPGNHQQLIAILQKLSLFAGLNDGQLEQVAGYIHPLNMKEGDTLHLEGTKCPFFIIVSGKLRFTSLKKGIEIGGYSLRAGDFCGADVVLRGKPQTFNLTALQPALLFSIQVDRLRLLVNAIPLLTKNIKKQAAWYTLIHSKPFAWLGEEETVKVICRKHPAYLLVLELGPLLASWAGLLVILFASQLATTSFRVVAGWFGAAVVAAACLWAIWRFYDWGNDYYILTDERIVWLERTVAIYDSRQEAPLVAIKSGETKSGLVGRWLGYGDLINETFMGQIFFRHIGNPAQIKSLVDTERRLALERQMSTDIHTIEGKIREKIEPSQAATVPVNVNDQVMETQPNTPSRQETQFLPEKISFWQALLARFQMRREVNGVITYRKHFYILFRMTLVPAGCTLAAIFATSLLYAWRVQGLISLWSPGTILLAGVGLTVSAFLWWLYKFIDWSNDIYRLTPEKIIDSERKPLGDEITKSAPLENIIGLDYERLGFLGVVLNFGNVMINIGTENKFIFYGIHNPARAQSDIFQYMFERRRKKLKSDTMQEQERVSSYIAAYHRQVEDLHRPKEPPQI
ncbi:MAG: hypothetical protein C3F13_18680 [Anaerolineales bacterium]|nr:cyclic nucleotide-binding domain-containing protein [Anaerolineae bacterium]PWB49430.1 MAG: hypothetical protein C3F13_18680 [Anaerolineales bacterium]